MRARIGRWLAGLAVVLAAAYIAAALIAKPAVDGIITDYPDRLLALLGR